MQRADQALALTEQRVQTEQSCLCVQPSSDERTERAQQQHTVCTAVVLRSLCSISSGPRYQGFLKVVLLAETVAFSWTVCVEHYRLRTYHRHDPLLDHQGQLKTNINRHTVAARVT